MMHTMDTMMKEVARLSLLEELEKMAAIDEDSIQYQSLSELQIWQLAKKIKYMPLEHQHILLLWYCFDLDSSEIEELLGITQVEEMLKYMNKLLSRRMGLKDSWIEGESMEEACRQYFIQMMREFHDMKAVGIPKYSREFREKLKGIRIRKSPATVSSVISKRVAAALLISALGFSTLLAVNGEAREKFLGWVIEVFPEFSIFERKGSGEPVDFNELEKFHPSYIPSGYWLEDTFKGFSIKLYQYTDENGEKITIQLAVSLEGTRNYLNTEGAKTEKIIIRGVEGYIIQNGNLTQLLWCEGGMDFLIAANLGREEVVKIAENIIKESE